MEVRIRAFWSLAFVLAAACSGGGKGDTESGPTIDESKPMLQPDGPLRGLAMVEEAGEDGSFSDPKLAFTTDDMEATAVLGLGEDMPEDSTLTVTWYRLTGIDGRERLFSHEIQVGPGGHAISQGVAAGGLAPGLYETVATYEERQVRTPWVVRVAGEVASAQAGMGAAFALMSLPSLAQVGDEDWNVPDSGDSSWYDPQEAAGDPPLPGPCTLYNIHSGFEHFVDVNASVSWSGTCSSLSMTATVSGPPQTVTSITDPNPALGLRGQTDACGLPGGSDFPGTVVRWAAAGNEGASATRDFTLPDFGNSLEAIVQAGEGTPTRVETGYRIELRGMAIVTPPALGVKELSLLAGDELIDKVGNASETSEPQPCDFGRYGAISRTSYTVPGSPPPVIQICAEGLGFDGTESRNCIEFYTGEVWEGTVDSTVSLVGLSRGGQSPCGDPTYVRGTAQIVVAEDGSATGKYDVTGCGVSEPHAEFTGTVTDEGFVFPELIVFTDGSLIPKVSPTEAKATLTNCQCAGGGGARWVTTWDLTCKTCG